MHQYTVQRHKVEKALHGLCYGYPEGGLDSPQGSANKIYNGLNHDDKPLQGCYFEYFPNQYYKSVSIKQDRINNLPQHRTQLPDLPIIELPEINPETDTGPAENQVTHDIPADDENLTHSGIVCPLEPKDVDTELRLTLNRLLGSEAATQQALSTR